MAERSEQNTSPETQNGHSCVSLLDVDNTLVDGFTVFTFTSFLLRQKLFRGQSLVQMQLDMGEYQRGKTDYGDFARNVVEHYSQGLAGLSEKAILIAGENFLSSYVKHLFPHTKDLIQLMRKQGKTIAVSGAPKEAFLPMARYLGIQESYLLEAEVKNGIYTGKTKVNMSLDESKKAIVEQISARGFNSQQSFAFGDSNHDLPILEAVSNPFAVMPNSALELIAKEKAWPIVNSQNILHHVKQRIADLDPKHN